jgi:predicted secreted hydrolase
VNPQRRLWLLALAAGAGPSRAAAPTAPTAQTAPEAFEDRVRRGRALAFPRDHGAHLNSRIEWWYITGWLGEASNAASQLPTGFQLTFFRSRTGLAQQIDSRFAARHVLFAHAAVTDLKNRRHLHDQRFTRWSGQAPAVLGSASLDGGAVHIGDWSLSLDSSGSPQRWLATLPARDFALRLSFTRTQPLLLQGEAGFSQKGPQQEQASHYYSEPQLLATGSTDLAKPTPAAPALTGRAWLDHEWSDQLLHPEAVGWDWLGINLFDGAALTAFVLRRADGSTLWAGGSYRAGPNGAVGATIFSPASVRLTPLRWWSSPSSGARYPVAWAISCPAGSFELHALLDAQEMDSRNSTGTVYWEGLSELRASSGDAKGQRLGLGYLEMTGYAGRLRLG